MKSYLDQLEVAAKRRKITLLAALEAVGIPDSTYYRWKSGQSSPRYETAKRVWDALQQRTTDPAPNPSIAA